MSVLIKHPSVFFTEGCFNFLLSSNYIIHKTGKLVHFLPQPERHCEGFSPEAISLSGALCRDQNLSSASGEKPLQ